MPTKVGNGGNGQENYDPNTGEYISENEASSISQNNEVEEATPVKSKLNLGGLKTGVKLSDLIKYKQDNIDTYSIPRLSTSEELFDNFDKFLTEQYIKNVAKDFTIGGYRYECNRGLRIPNSGGRSTDIWIVNLGMFRYKENHATLLNRQDFFSIMDERSYNDFIRSNYWNASNENKIPPMMPVVRGHDGDKREYAKRNNLYIYGAMGNWYGTNVYTTISNSYGSSYGRGSNFIRGFYDTNNSYYMTLDELRNKREIFINKYKNQVKDKVYNRFKNVLQDDYKAQEMTKSFMFSLCETNDSRNYSSSVKGDEGLFGVLLGLDFFISEGHQRNLLNLNRWKILDE